MILRELQEQWFLERDSPSRDAYGGRRIQLVTAFEAYAGVDKEGLRRFVAIRLDPQERKCLGDKYPRSSRGVVVESVPLPAGKTAYFLREQSGIPDSVFPLLMKDVLAAALAAQKGKELRVAFERFASWQSALSRHTGAMSDREVRGIFGELVVARDLLIPSLGFPRMLQAWRAPDGDHIHDFVGADWELEVKTFLAPGSDIHVNADGQLEPEHGNRMFLAGVELERDGEGLSLLELLDQIRALTESGSSTREALENALVRRGVALAALDGAGGCQYRLSEVGIYDVKEGFPLISRKTLPAGVSKVEYRISIPACASFAIELSVLRTTIEQMEH